MGVIVGDAPVQMTEQLQADRAEQAAPGSHTAQDRFVGWIGPDSLSATPICSGL